MLKIGKFISNIGEIFQPHLGRRIGFSQLGNHRRLASSKEGEKKPKFGSATVYKKLFSLCQKKSIFYLLLRLELFANHVIQYTKKIEI